VARTAARIYVPLDAVFFERRPGVDMSEQAQNLYLRMCAKAKMLDCNGALSAKQIGSLGLTTWRKRLTELLTVVDEDGKPPVTERDDGTYYITGWLNWNESSEARADRLAKDREKKAKYREQREAEGDN